MDDDVLAVFVANVLRVHFTSAEIEGLIWQLGGRPGDILLHPRTIGEFAQAAAKWFAQRGRIDDLLRVVVNERNHPARKWAKEMLHRRFQKSQRDDLLRALRVSPGDVILDPPSDEHHAWEIVEYFDRRSELWQLVRGIVLRMVAPQQPPDRPFVDLPQLTAGT